VEQTALGTIIYEKEGAVSRIIKVERRPRQFAAHPNSGD
jgi:hypothetical protein